MGPDGDDGTVSVNTTAVTATRTPHSHISLDKVLLARAGGSDGHPGRGRLEGRAGAAATTSRLETGPSRRSTVTSAGPVRERTRPERTSDDDERMRTSVRPAAPTAVCGRTSFVTAMY